MTDYDAFLAQLDQDRPDWPLEFAEQRDLLDALRPLLKGGDTTYVAERTGFAARLLRGRVGPRLWNAVQSSHLARAKAA